MTTKTRPRLGRGLSGLISISDPTDDLPEIPSTPLPTRTPPAPVMPSSVPVVHRSIEASSPTTSPTAGLPASGSPPSAPAAGAAHPPPAAPDSEKPNRGILDVPLDRIVPNPHQPRRQMNETAIAELAASLKSTGLIQPIVVKKSGEQYELIAGERRWRAAKIAGLTTVPAIVREASTFEQAQMALVENIQREDLNPIDRAQAYRTLMTQLGLTQAELANRTGEDRSSVANYLRLLDLAESVQTMVVSGQLSMGHAKILAGVADKADQIRLAELAVNQSLSVRNLERQLQNPQQPVTRSVPAPSPHLIDLEKSLSQQLGLRVQVKSAAQKGHGKLVLHYASLDQFDDLVNRLGAKVEA